MMGKKIKHFQKREKLLLLQNLGPGIFGTYSKNLNYAFSDQDDFWLNDKIERGLKVLEAYDNTRPLLYIKAIIVDENLNIIEDNSMDKIEVLSFPKSLVRSAAPGCTFIFNYEAIKILRQYNISQVDIHDWLAHKIISGLGIAVLDSCSKIYYRQHDSNVIGAKK